MGLGKQSSRRLPHLFMRFAQRLRILFYRCVSTNRVIGKPKRFQPLQCAGSGEVSIDDNVCIGVFPSPWFLSGYAFIEARNPSARVTIGTGTWLNNGFCAIAEHTSILIGENCRIGVNVSLYDSDFHGLAVKDRSHSLREWSSPVVVHRDVFIGSNVMVMKGVTIGVGSIIAAGSVVTSSIPPGVIAAGNPARVIRTIETHD